MSEPFDPAWTFPFPLGPDDSPPEPSAEPLPLCVVYGDSFTTGYADWGVGEANWATQVARSLNCNLANMAVGGSGYVQCPGWSTFPREVVVNPVTDASLVIVFGGFNDRMTPGSNAIGVAAETTFAAVRALMPDASLLVVGPQWPSAQPPAHMYAHRDAVRDAALEAKGAWVDPIAGGWFADPRELIWPGDGIHPTDAGHRRLADLIRPHVAALLGR